MPYFKPDDWIKNRKNGAKYRVLYVHRDGTVLVEDPDGDICVLTRPEEFHKTTPPDDPNEESAP